MTSSDQTDLWAALIDLTDQWSDPDELEESIVDPNMVQFDLTAVPQWSSCTLLSFLLSTLVRMARVDQYRPGFVNVTTGD